MIYETLTIRQALQRKAIKIVGRDALKSMIKLKIEEEEEVPERNKSAAGLVDAAEPVEPFLEEVRGILSEEEKEKSWCREDDDPRSERSKGLERTRKRRG